MNQRLIHDARRGDMHAILDLVGSSLREEERAEAMNEFYLVCRAGIEAYEIQSDRLLLRMSPTKN